MLTGASFSIGTWKGWVRGLSENFGTISTAQPSLVLCVLSRQHQNEERNLSAKIEDACLNLTRHGPTSGLNSTNAIYIHLDQDASMVDCEAWAQKWLDEHPDAPVASILLYQAVVVRDDDLSRIYHGFRQANATQFGPWLQRNGDAVPALTVPIGIVGTEPAVLAAESPDGHRLPLSGAYVFQAGNVYVDAVATKSGTQVAPVGHPRAGVHVHSVMEPHSDGRKLVVSGMLPPSDDLLIL